MLISIPGVRNSMNARANPECSHDEIAGGDDEDESVVELDSMWLCQG